MMNGVLKEYIPTRSMKVKVFIFAVVGFLLYIAVHHMLTAIVGSTTHSYAVIKIAKDLIVFAVFLIVVAILIVKHRLTEYLLSDKLNLLIILYVLLQLVMLLPVLHTDTKAGIAGLIFNVRFLILFMFVRIGIASLPLSTDRLRSLLTKTPVVVATAVSLFGLMQVTALPAGFMRHLGYDGVNTIAPVSTVDNNSSAQRAFSTMRGPNELGSYLILPICIALVITLRGRRKVQVIIALVIMVFALYFTYSRSALLGSVVAILATVMYANRLHFSRRLKLAALSAALGLGLLLSIAVYTVPSVRLAVFHSSSSDNSLTEGSTGDHYVAVRQGIEDVVAHPLGRGTGQAGPASFYDASRKPRIAENYYIQIAQEVGILGLGLFIGICWMVFKRLIGEKDSVAYAVAASLIGISVNALFLHTWADEAVAYTWWVMAAVFVGGVRLEAGQKARVRKGHLGMLRRLASWFGQ